jgi:hypothetical protein
MIHKFIEMLYEMYGNGYEDAIECFADDIFRSNKQDFGLDQLFIEWGKFVEQGKTMA